MTRRPLFIGEAAGVLAAYIRHRHTILPQVRRELAEWRRTAASIPDAALRAHALAALTGKAGNVEATAVLAGQKVIHKRLHRGQEEELPELAPQLWEWLFSYPVPPGPLKATRRRTVKAVPFEERRAQSSPPERLLRALAAVVAEKGYPDATVAEIVERASTSQRTFYEHFKSKEDAIVAALDSGSAHMLAAALPAFRRAPDWPHAVQTPRRRCSAGAPKSPSTHGSAGSRCTRRASAPSTSARWSPKGSRGCSPPATS